MSATFGGFQELLVLTLGRMGLRCDTASSLGDARALLRHNQYALCLTDMRRTDGSGIDLVQEMLRELKFPEELIINRKRERFDRFLEARRKEIENCYWSEEYAKNHTERLHRNQDSGL